MSHREFYASFPDIHFRRRELDAPGLSLENASLHYANTISAMISKRQQEFLLGRLCLLEALNLAGYEGMFWSPYLPKKPPTTPEGFSASLSHSGNVALAAAVKSDNLLIGVDCEIYPDVGRVRSLSSYIMQSAEQERLGKLAEEAGFALVFSAKETLFKTLYPVVQRHVGFEGAMLLDVQRGDDTQGVLTLKLDSPLWGAFDQRRVDVSFDLQETFVQTFLQLQKRV